MLPWCPRQNPFLEGHSTTCHDASSIRIQFFGGRGMLLYPLLAVSMSKLCHCTRMARIPLLHHQQQASADIRYWSCSSMSLCLYRNPDLLKGRPQRPFRRSAIKRDPLSILKHLKEVLVIQNLQRLRAMTSATPRHAHIHPAPEQCSSASQRKSLNALQR